MISLLAGAFFMRSLVGFDVSKDRVLYRENAEGRIENVYSLKIMNKDQRDHTYVLDAAGLPDLKLQGRREIKVAAGDIVDAACAGSFCRGEFVHRQDSGSAAFTTSPCR